MQHRDQRLLLGLIGSPIGHSAAPAMHEAAGDALGLRTLYRLMDVPGADAGRLRELLHGARECGFAGVNVTYPYKQAVLPLLDGFATGVRAMGAVNTVVFQGGRMVGHNTDESGLRTALQALGPTVVAIVGAGGVGRAAAFALRALGCGVRVFDTDPARAGDLAREVGGAACGTVLEALAGAGGLFNGTPVGMLPSRGCPVDPALLHPGLWVADAVYYPLLTPLLAAARSRGCQTVDGGALAVHQARDAFHLFTGRAAPPGCMEAAFAAHMAQRAHAA